MTYYDYNPYLSVCNYHFSEIKYGYCQIRTNISLFLHEMLFCKLMYKNDMLTKESRKELIGVFLHFSIDVDATE